MSKVFEWEGLPIAMAAITGIVIVFLSGLAIRDSFDGIFRVITASYFLPGLTAGYWTWQVGSGFLAAVVVAVVCITYLFSLVIRGYEVYLIMVIFTIVLGPLGGLAGKLIKSSIKNPE